MAIYPNSNLPTASQPWGRAIQNKLETVDSQFLTERTNNAARDAQLQASYTRLDKTVIDVAAAAASAQAAIDEITGVTTNIYVAGTTNINGGTIQTGTISASSISAGTMTGFTINTAASGARVQLGGSMVSFWNSSDTMTGIVLSDGSSITMRNTISGTGWPSGSSSQMVLDAGVSYWQAQSGSFGCTVTLNSNTLAVGGSITATSNITATGDVRGSYIYSSNTALISGQLNAAGNIAYTGYASGLGTGTALYLSSSAGGYKIGILASSRRFKDNIQPLENISYVDKISLLTPVTFTYKENPTQSSFGLIAEDVDDAGLTGIVHKDVDENGDLVPFSLMYDRLAVYMIPAIKELNERLKTLEGK